MRQLDEIILEFQEISQSPKKSVLELMKRSGKKTIGCFPLYTPEEIVYAAGALPIGMWGGQHEIKKSDKYLQSFCCSIMRENLEQGLNGVYDMLSGVIIPTYCDTLKCICENWKYAVPNVRSISMVYPQNKSTKSGKIYMKEEYIRVASELEEILETKITDEALIKSINVYEEYRRTARKFVSLVKKYPLTLNANVRHEIIKAAYFSDKQIYTEKLSELISALEKKEPEDHRGIKVVITGILAEPAPMLTAFSENNVCIVADDLAHETRQFRTSILNQLQDPLDMLVERNAMQMCALLYDEKKSRGQLLKDLVSENNADGVVISMLKFCDPEEFDYPIYKKELEEAGIPMLYLEIEQKMDSVEQLKTRIQAFKESLA